MPAASLVRVVVAAGAALLLSTSVFAQGAAPPDLNGFWINQYTPDLSAVLG